MSTQETEVARLEHVTSTDGTQLGVWRSGAGPPLLLVHGTTADHTRWNRVALLFAEHFTVHALDRRGRGASGDAAVYSIEQEGRDVVAVVDAIGGGVSVVGHSYGAICCLEAALLTSRIRRLVLYEPPIPVGPVLTPENARIAIDELIARGEGEAALLTFFREVVKVPEEQLTVMRSQPVWQARVAAAHTLTREMRVESDYSLDFERLRPLSVPTLLLLGGESGAAFREATERVHAALPDSRIAVMPGQQHVAMDMIPAEFVAIVTRFLLEA